MSGIFLDHPHDAWRDIAVKVRAFCAGEGQTKDAADGRIHSHGPEGDKCEEVRAFPAGEDLRGALAYVVPTTSPAYFCPDATASWHARALRPGDVVTILGVDAAPKARGDVAVRVVGPGGDVGWLWMSCLRLA